MITILAGGTGSVKLVRGIYSIYKDISIISNVADNFWYYGLYICPDIDTMIYGLSNNLDTKKGWGINEDTFNLLNYMREIGEESWFGLGDKDLTTHILRTKMLREGKNLSQITDYFVKKYKLSIKIIPASNDHYETRVISDSKMNMHLQDFWIRYKGSITISDIIYKDIEKAKMTDGLNKILEKSNIILFAPGNPITSIGSIIKIESFSRIIKTLKEKVVIISPFISNKVVSGPSEIYMKAKNIEPTLNGLINYYSEYTNNMIFSYKDEEEIREKLSDKYPSIKFHFTDILMDTFEKETAFAEYIISNFKF